jgi:hypothetical protein
MADTLHIAARPPLAATTLPLEHLRPVPATLLPLEHQPATLPIVARPPLAATTLPLEHLLPVPVTRLPLEYQPVTLSMHPPVTPTILTIPPIRTTEAWASADSTVAAASGADFEEASGVGLVAVSRVGASGAFADRRGRSQNASAVRVLG